jgi:hypothetical protein
VIAPGIDTDVRVLLTALVLALGALVHAMAHTAAEGALPLHRWTMRAAGVVLLLGAVYAAARLWW